MLNKLKNYFLFDKHICPWWLAYTWDNRIREYFQNPDIILKPYIKPGITALDVGCGMGYFSIHLAKYTGENGKIISVDIQKRMTDYHCPFCKATSTAIIMATLLTVAPETASTLVDCNSMISTTPEYLPI